MGISRFLVRPWLRGLHFYSVTGLENIPREGPAILAPNHTTYGDPFFLTYPMVRPLFYLAWDKLFTVPVLAWGMRRHGGIPVDTRERADRSAYEGALRVLRGGNLLCIFPEGIRGWDGELNPLQAGVARLSVATGAPIVPTWIEGGIRAWPRWRILPRPFEPISVRFMPPILPPMGKGKGAQREAVPGLLGELEAKMLEGRRLSREAAR